MLVGAAMLWLAWTAVQVYLQPIRVLSLLDVSDTHIHALFCSHGHSRPIVEVNYRCAGSVCYSLISRALQVASTNASMSSGAQTAMGLRRSRNVLQGAS